VALKLGAAGAGDGAVDTDADGPRAGLAVGQGVGLGEQPAADDAFGGGVITVT